MRLGLTYDLRSVYLAEGYSEEETAEFDRDDTIEAIESALRRVGHTTDRIGHLRALIARLAKGERWDLVFNIAEGMYGIGREAQVPALLDAYQIPYTFSDPVVLGLTLHKGWTKRLVRDAGIPTPDFAIIEDEEDLATVKGEGPFFAKPIAEGTGKGVSPKSKVMDRPSLHRQCMDLLSRYRQPVLVETFLPGREFTVGILGTGKEASVLGTMEIVLLPAAEEEVYSYINKERCEELVEYRLVRKEKDPTVAEAEAIALHAWRILGCRDGGRVDLRCDSAGRPQFLEVNPLAGLHPEHSDLPMIATKVGMSYDELIRQILHSALRRLR